MIKATFNIDKLFAGVYQKVDLIMSAVEEALQMVCLEVVQKAKALGTGSPAMAGHPHQPNYIEWTHYLKASIGYAVYNNGEKVAEHFDAGSGGNGLAGVKKGQELADSVAREYPSGIVAVIVAGAEYAAYVESKGYDVLTSPTNEAESLLKKYLQIAIDELRE